MPNTDSRLRSRELRTHSICWLMTANSWPTPNNAVHTSSATTDPPDAHNPALAALRYLIAKLDARFVARLRKSGPIPAESGAPTKTPVHPEPAGLWTPLT